MSQVTPQVDVGGLTLNGLAAFGPLLAALSADNVPPLAMIQMENLGSLFHINGKYALQVPDLLQRYKSTRMDRLGLLIGWRKGDAASLMSQSAGGQAISLLSMCILSLYDDSDSGLLLSALSKNVLPRAIAISSPSQLVQVAKSLSPKLEVLGFGNILAAQVVRVYDAYKHFGKSVPENFLDSITPDSLAELLYAITRAVREDSTVVRITGSRSVGLILAIVTIMFPEDTFVTIENVIVFDGLRKKILVEFTDSEEVINVRIESKLQIQSSVPILPICTKSSIPALRSYCYKWTGCMADMLQVMFVEEGLICPEALRVACCDMFEPLSKTLGNCDSEFDKIDLLGNRGLIRLLGLYPRERIERVCQELWRIPLGWAKSASSLESAFRNLMRAFAEATPNISCTCKPEHRCFIDSGWLEYDTGDYSNGIEPRSCPLYRLWRAVGDAICCGLCCLFINADDAATIVHPMGSSVYRSILRTIPDLRNLPDYKIRKQRYTERLQYDTVYRSIAFICGANNGIASSSNSSTVYMAALQTPRLPNKLDAQFILVEGQLIFNGRYHRSLVAVGQDRPEAEDIRRGTQPIIPSSIGEHSSLELTILEAVHFLQLTTTIVLGGVIVHPNLQDIILASWEAREADRCNHPANTPLEAQYEPEVVITSVATTNVLRRRMAIAQVSRNPVAQLLACDFKQRTLLQTGCCLNCLCEEARKTRNTMIIVA
ncbi:hypothetical protein V491_04483 [Pseudogymnoascus sp. VKM F-3775]|nr:hypothetical protein V491_04483 [Pseudogymnoascus sp. VKM F-3775]